jgi:hypothetical protein
LFESGIFCKRLKFEIMKNYFLLLIGLVLLASSCEPEKLEVTPPVQNIGSDEGTITFSINSNTSWTVTDNADWLTVSPASGSGNGIITATYTANALITQQVAIITVSGTGVGPITVTLTQAGTPEPTVDVTWAKKADLPTARGFLPPSASLVNGKIYVIGGFGTSNVYNNVEEYDPATDLWTSKSPLSTQRWGHSSDVVGGKIYVMGGCTTSYGDASSSIEVYDPALDMWESQGNMQTARLGFGSCVINGKIYVIGGRTKEPSGDYLASMEAYDPVTKTWETKSPLPAARGYLTATATSTYIYVIGGTQSGNSGIPESTVYKYNISANTWTETTKMHYARWGIASCLVGNMIVCIGGYAGATDPGQNTIEIIFTESDDFVKASRMSFNRAACSVCEVNGNIYVFGGINSPDPTYNPCNYNEEGIIDLN